ncbi:MAG: beta-lactamase family protein [Acidipila sp.]|nr:beta-lactamase family protein [Acidipila sp.]
MIPSRMTKLNGYVRTVAAVALLTASLVTMPLSKSSTDPMQSKIDRIFAPVIAKDSPGAAVLVRAAGRPLFQSAYGVRELRTRAPIDAQTNFRLASCSKQFTAMAVMLLVHDGKLRYEDRLTDVFPNFPTYGRAITIRHLLNHTSGLPDYEDLMDRAVPDHAVTGAAPADKPFPWSDARQIQDDEVLALLEAQSAGKFPPGTAWSYSNSGYVVLGLVVAKISGKPFDEFLRERIFQPLKMNRTVAYRKGKNDVTNRAYGHSRENNASAGHGRSEFTQTDQSATSATLGDGGIYSNLEDLARWDQALANRTLITAAELEPALTPAKLVDGSVPRWPSAAGESDSQAGKPVSYGFGWFLDPYEGHQRMWHYGDTVGFKSVVDRFMKDRLTVIVLCNRSDLDPAALAAKVAQLYFDAANYMSKDF